MACVLRVPVLYGYDQKTINESASLVVADSLRGIEPKWVDDWAVRYPTAVDDVSQCLRLIIQAKLVDKTRLHGVFHCSSSESATKFAQAKLMAKCLGLPSDHLSPNSDPPGGAPRPRDVQLDCSATWAALGATVSFTTLEAGYGRALAPFQEAFCKAPLDASDPAK